MNFKKYAVIFFTITAMFVSPLLFSQVSRNKQSNLLKQQDTIKTNFFPVSVWYSGGKARAPMLSQITSKSKSQWLKDLQQIKSLGFNTVRTWVEWTHTEPKEGEYNFKNLRMLLDLANKTGLKIIIQMYIDSAPDWVGKKYKNALFTTQSGDKMIPQSAPGYSLDNPGVRKAVADLFKRTAEVAIQYPNFYGWDIWSEPHIINWASMDWIEHPQFGFNVYTQEKFREWLKKKYKTLSNLNKAWYRTFLSWKDVQAPRFSTILSYTDFIDWRLFLYHKIAEDMRFKYNAVRSVDHTHVITAHASPPSLWSTPLSGTDAANDFQRAKQLNYYGLSLYPKHNDSRYNWTEQHIQTALAFEYSANAEHGGFYVGELQAGQGTVGLKIGEPITGSDLRNWMWSCVAAGAKAINIYAYYPMSSGYESGGYGLINLNGTVTPRAITAGEIAKIINKNSNLFVNSSPVKPEVAIVYNPLAQMVGGLNAIGQAVNSARLHTESLIGYYNFFSSHNIPAGFISLSDLKSPNISSYKLIIIPCSMLFTMQATNELMNYAANGGHVIGEARFAWNDSKGYASLTIPGMGLSKLFGVSELRIKKEKEPAMKVVDEDIPLAGGLKKADLLKGAFFEESLKVLEAKNNPAKVLADFEDGTPSITFHKYGKGGAVFIGTFLGLANQSLPDAPAYNSRFLEDVIHWAGVQLPYFASEAGSEGVQVSLQKDKIDGSYLMFIINHKDSVKKFSVGLNLNSLNLKSSKDVSLTEIISNKKLQIRVRKNEAIINSELPPKSAQVWHIEN